MDMNMEEALVLTAADRVILGSYKVLCDGLADYLGEGYEIVLHSLEDYERSVIKIINGSHTGRKEGAPITDLALRMLATIREREGASYLSYSSRNRKGEPLHSCTITIKGEGERVIGLLCINFYLNTPLSKIVASLFAHQTPQPAGEAGQETFVDSSEDLVVEMVSQIKTDVYADPTVSAQNKNKEIIRRLAEKKLFQLKDSVNQCAAILGISKNTVYLHLRNGAQDSGD